ncbi:MAG: hypothetical protein HZC51_00920 [Nitrospirae bacterium]|nr:hypothetical protein [Nitrospirota bacterium]
MRIITVSGSHSGVGKTTLALLLLARLSGYGAVKVSMTDFFTSVTDDPDKVCVPGKDTALMKDAGAAHVVFAQCTTEELSECLSYALNLLGGVSGAVIEGNSPARLLDPDTAFFVTGADVSAVKPSALEVLARADVVVVNVEEYEPHADTEAAVRRHNRSAVITTMRRMREPDVAVTEFFARLSDSE